MKRFFVVVCLEIRIGVFLKLLLLRRLVCFGRTVLRKIASGEGGEKYGFLHSPLHLFRQLM